jgi:hypothetical protein
MKDLLKEITSVSEIIDFIDKEEFKLGGEVPRPLGSPSVSLFGQTPPVDSDVFGLGFG